MRRTYQLGDQALTITEVVERTGLGPSTIAWRDAHGLPLDAPYGGHFVRYEFRGKTLSVAGWAKEWDISTKNARQRLEYYANQHQAIRIRDGVRRRSAIKRK